MDAGLHIGIAAWIHAQGDTRGFAVSPALPIAMSVGDLQVATTMHDVVRAWEFAQLANGELREGRPLDGSASPLWALTWARTPARTDSMSGRAASPSQWSAGKRRPASSR